MVNITKKLKELLKKLSIPQLALLDPEDGRGNSK
tara:strand:- start:77 stop:178 length:102 start_codon:yes stop_codon:yes gene_type:complete